MKPSAVPFFIRCAHDAFHEPLRRGNRGLAALRFPNVMKSTLIALCIATTALAADPDRQAVNPDNTRRNAAEQTTAENQGGSAADREMTKTIRASLMRESKLSTLAKNVKIITVGGNVTLRGPVHSEQEKADIGALAEKAAGKGKVTNQLEVKQQKQ